MEKDTKDQQVRGCLTMELLRNLDMGAVTPSHLDVLCPKQSTWTWAP